MTLAERMRLLIEMPRLTRAERNQRLTIVTFILLVGLYFLIRPLMAPLLDRRAAPAAAPSVAPAGKADDPHRRNWK